MSIPNVLMLICVKRIVNAESTLTVIGLFRVTNQTSGIGNFTIISKTSTVMKVTKSFQNFTLCQAIQKDTRFFKSHRQLCVLEDGVVTCVKKLGGGV